MNSDNYGRPVPPEDMSANQYSSSQPEANTAPIGTQAQPVNSYNAAARKNTTQKKSGGGFKSFFFGLVGGIVAIALVLCLGSFTPLLDAFKGKTVSSNNGDIVIDTSSDDISLAQAIAAKDLDSVVTIYVYSDTTSDWSQLFGGSTSSNSPSALGSGVIVSTEGDHCYILTNYHVVEGISRAVVKVGDEQYEAKSVGYDSKTDLAVLEIEASGLKAIEWGDSSSVQVGDWVMAIGSPYGYEQTVTTGIVSAMYRSDVIASETSSGSSTVYTDMIQTDASINPGNSGGALVDSEGKLIGINTYISSTSQSSAGLGFAIPVDTAKRVAEQLIAGQTVTHAFLGITMGKSSNPAGVQVTSVYKDTAAANAGLQTGDVITKIDGKSVTSTSEVSIAVSSKNVGDTMEITYVRNGSEATTTATLGSDDAKPSEYANNGAPATQNNNGNNYNYPYGSGNSGNSNGYGYGYPFGLGDLFGGMGSRNSGSGSGSTGNSGSGNSGGDSGSFWN